jgi:hypothetical protein
MAVDGQRHETGLVYSAPSQASSRISVILNHSAEIGAASRRGNTGRIGTGQSGRGSYKQGCWLKARPAKPLKISCRPSRSAAAVPMHERFDEFVRHGHRIPATPPRAVQLLLRGAGTVLIPSDLS